jgi:ADP-ribosylglycohydrolase
VISSIAGDVIGSRYEFNNDLPPDCCFMKENIFTDDTVLSIATSDVLLNNKDYAQTYLEYAQTYPNRGYGGMFSKVVKSGVLKRYNSYGNGSMMRIGPIGWVFHDFLKTAKEADKSASVTHDHIEGRKGAVAIACSMLMLRRGESKEEIRKFLEKKPFYYDLSKRIKDFPRKFDVTCQGILLKKLC